jgi:hypothetical protein
LVRFPENIGDFPPYLMAWLRVSWHDLSSLIDQVVNVEI